MRKYIQVSGIAEIAAVCAIAEDKGFKRPWKIQNYRDLVFLFVDEHREIHGAIADQCY